MSHGKIRVNITVDQENLLKAKTKLRMFGGKLSTLFDAYLADFASSIDKSYSSEKDSLMQKLAELESRIKKLEVRK